MPGARGPSWGVIVALLRVRAAPAVLSSLLIVGMMKERITFGSWMRTLQILPPSFDNKLGNGGDGDVDDDLDKELGGAPAKD